MRIKYIDASEMMANVLAELPPEPRLSVHIGDPDDDGVVDLAAEAEVILNGHTTMSADLLARLPALRKIVFLGTGASSYIDMEAAATLGIAVENVTGYGDRSVAEMALALLLDCARRVTQMDRELRAGLWEPREGLLLQGRRLGLIGFGGIGTEMAHIGRALGMEIAIWNRSEVAADWRDCQRSLEEVLASSDMISLHLALTPQTRGFLDAQAFAAMKPGAIFVNTARGALVDEAALIAALRSGHVAQAGLDVFETEPLPAESPLRDCPNLVLAAHAGFKTRDAARTLLAKALAKID
ncbi:2-hydroxyacid dehydrogenase [Pseudodonghicola flavimaris]|uniref:NAD(P)-dependent oxidoreductase n=1 Tax=Pseudodonghicola flavimaris TaxID=3050036 RepID=A0ABT7F1T2_9RHOB|nr:NAD(P)-dependent oxidoreductase [Pseudodonghicola flavimaris]MDK3018556.1 NAD(P)-dependent oxidoreductase [Pseudodonghicola flavimaris]